MSQIPEEALAEFFAECDEISQRVSANLQLLETNQQEDGLIDSLYRDVHTMKGSAQLFGFHLIGQIAHAMEATLDPLRRVPAEVPSEFVDKLLQCLDLIEKMIQTIRGGGSDTALQSEADVLLPRLIETASRFFQGEYDPQKNSAAVSEDLSKPQVQAAPPAPAPVQETAPEPTPDPTPVPVQSEKPEPTPSPNPVQSKEAPMNEEKAPAKASAAQPVDTTIRVQVDLLDKLMNLVGELVLVRNQVLQFSSSTDNVEFINLSQNLDVVTSDLQDEVMKTRMQPIGNILTKYQRVVRDLARDLDKKIELKLTGMETELDRTLLEAIKDPLMHIVRNSCDHGIEDKEARKAAGKSEQGRVEIKAFHEGGQVVIEIVDDGKGLDRSKLLSKAIERGIITPDRAERMSDREAYSLIFAAGFSTAQKVSNVSGRGVGMDVVKTNIEKIGGAIDLNSSLGAGTSIKLKIPLTLAIVPAMIVRLGESKYAIPQIKLVELVRVEKDENTSIRLEYLQDRPVFRLRGNLLPLVSLSEVLHGEPVSKNLTEEDVNIVVLNADGKYFGLMVDEVLDTADIVVKPLGQTLKSLDVFSGATIMGDGNVALILDVTGIAQHSHIDVASKDDGKQAIATAEKGDKKDVSDAQEFLLFSVNAPSTYAVPLCLVSRLEEFKQEVVEYSGEQRVVRYRDSILPIISLNKILGYEEDQKEAETISVIVTQKSNRLFGIQVNSILDVVLVGDAIDDSFRDRKGVMGNLVIDENVVVVVDVLEIMDRLLAERGVTSAGKQVPVEAVEDQPGAGLSILYAEDAPFFRKQVAKVLTRAGFKIQTAENGRAALDVLESSQEGEFDLLLSDIEMPEMTGWEFATEVRKSEKFKGMPMIALTTRFKQRDIEKGAEVGFNLYLEKLNAEKLLNGIKQLMSKRGS